MIWPPPIPPPTNAVFLLAAGGGPKPTAILLHGLPGNERNLDLAQAMRRAGWNVLAFTYRGAWGSLAHVDPGRITAWLDTVATGER